MSNLTFDEKLVREHGAEPLEGHTVVVLERVGKSGEKFDSVLEPGDPPRGGILTTLLGRPSPYFAFAVDASKSRSLAFQEHVEMAERPHEFDLQFSLWYRVSDPQLLVSVRETDPLERVRQKVAETVVGEIAELRWAEVWRSFRAAGESVVSGLMAELKSFARDYGIAITELRLRPGFPACAVETEARIHEVRQKLRLDEERIAAANTLRNRRRSLQRDNAESDELDRGAAARQKYQDMVARAVTDRIGELIRGAGNMEELEDLRAPLGGAGMIGAGAQWRAHAIGPGPREGMPARRAESPPPAYARVEAPESVVAGTEFDAMVGVSPRGDAKVIGQAFEFPASTAYPYRLAVQLLADGFELADGGSWRREMTATADAPHPFVAVRLRALPQEEPVHARVLQVIYSVGGQTIGFAVRPLAVLRTPAYRLPGALPPDGPAVDVRVPTESVPPDLTLHVLRDPDVRGRLKWTLESPHPGVQRLAGDGAPAECDIGDQPRRFARELIQQVDLQTAAPVLKLQMRGIGKQIARKVPTAVWEAIHAAAAAAGGPPSILILSDEPHVPWELALVPPPLPCPGEPPFLGAQANVGRWVLGQAAPPLPPPHQLTVGAMAVVWGDYGGSPWPRLKGAEEEAAELRRAYGADLVDARIGPVLRCLEGTPPADALHFALHGVYNPGGIEDGLILTDRESIRPTTVSGGDLPQRPLVFLNACQVGSGQEVLGDPAGMACAFLDARASAVIAPLWKVDDALAREISLAFYREALAGLPVAAALRRLRARYGASGSATYLAYQYFGHPELRLHRGAGLSPRPLPALLNP